MTIFNSRGSDHPIDVMFLDRWSPRAFTAEPISEFDLLTMIEAGCWAASSFNSQPWRFLYARRDTAHWERFLQLLLPFNQSWAQRASALVVFVSDPIIRQSYGSSVVVSHSHSFDTGAASACFSLQARKMGWYVHGMTGIDIEKTATELKVPKNHRVEAAFAVGRRSTDESQLPEKLRARERPSSRLPLSQLAFEGGFAASHEHARQAPA